MTKQTINPNSLFDSNQYGFSQITLSNPGKLVFISGQVAWDAQMNIVGENDLARQTRQALG